MAWSGGGAIVSNASMATKHRVIGLPKMIAAEFGKHGVRRNAVCLGYVATEMHERANQCLAGERNISVVAMKQERYAGVAILIFGGTPAGL